MTLDAAGGRAHPPRPGRDAHRSRKRRPSWASTPARCIANANAMDYDSFAPLPRFSPCIIGIDHECLAIVTESLIFSLLQSQRIAGRPYKPQLLGAGWPMPHGNSRRLQTGPPPAMCPQGPYLPRNRRGDLSARLKNVDTSPPAVASLSAIVRSSGTDNSAVGTVLANLDSATRSSHFSASRMRSPQPCDSWSVSRQLSTASPFGFCLWRNSPLIQCSDRCRSALLMCSRLATVFDASSTLPSPDFSKACA